METSLTLSGFAMYPECMIKNGTGSVLVMA